MIVSHREVPAIYRFHETPKIMVYLDGVYQMFCTCLNTDQQWITRHFIREDGRFEILKPSYDAQKEICFGKVTFKINKNLVRYEPYKSMQSDVGFEGIF